MAQTRRKVGQASTAAPAMLHTVLAQGCGLFSAPCVPQGWRHDPGEGLWAPLPGAFFRNSQLLHYSDVSLALGLNREHLDDA